MIFLCNYGTKKGRGQPLVSWLPYRTRVLMQLGLVKLCALKYFQFCCSEEGDGRGERDKNLEFVLGLLAHLPFPFRRHQEPSNRVALGQALYPGLSSVVLLYVHQCRHLSQCSAAAPREHLNDSRGKNRYCITLKYLHILGLNIFKNDVLVIPTISTHLLRIKCVIKMYYSDCKKGTYVRSVRIVVYSPI
jgi:hypothetical protein